MCVFEIRFAAGVEKDLRNIRIYYRNQILDAIEKQLAHEPDTRTRNRKLLENLIPPWQTDVKETKTMNDQRRIKPV